MRLALTRAVSPNIGQCELTHMERQPIDADLAQAQHHQYETGLTALGYQLVQLPAEPGLPDSVFVEDTAVVLDELAIITRPGADSRKPETISIAKALEPYRTLHAIIAPGTVDGGDVLRVGKTLYVGLSSRSNQAAIDQMTAILKPFGYMVHGVQVNGFLHLKSAVTQVAEQTLLINPKWVDAAIFGDVEIIEIDPTEAYAANALLLGETVIYPTSYPRTCQKLEQHGIAVRTVDVSALIKAEGAVTCCSLIFNG
ncbi:hydrolase [soil metagenome]